MVYLFEILFLTADSRTKKMGKVQVRHACKFVFEQVHNLETHLKELLYLFGKKVSRVSFSLFLAL